MDKLFGNYYQRSIGGRHKYNFDEKTLDDRVLEFRKLTEKYPGRILVIVEKGKDSNAPDLDKNKFLVPKELTFANFVCILRKRMKIDPAKSLFFFAKNTTELKHSDTALKHSDTMVIINSKYADEDGFLKISYTTETTLG